MPVNVPGWLEHLAGVEFSYGTRIHGNIAAILAGTPAYVLAHDSRTAELAEYHAIPHRTMGKNVANLDAAELYAQSDYAAMLERHRTTWAGFADFLAAHGLQSIYSPDSTAGDFDERISVITFPPVATLQPRQRTQVLLTRAVVIAGRLLQAVRYRVLRLLGRPTR